jgi:hypothetical protein
VKVTAVFAIAQTGEGFTVNAEVGAAFTVMVLVVVELQVPEVTVNDTVLLPAVDQLTVCGPAVAAVAGLASAPKFHE